MSGVRFRLRLELGTPRTPLCRRLSAGEKFPITVISLDSRSCQLNAGLHFDGCQDLRLGSVARERFRNQLELWKLSGLISSFICLKRIRAFQRIICIYVKVEIPEDITDKLFELKMRGLTM